jgi:putative ABC transport system permease protein
LSRFHRQAPRAIRVSARPEPTQLIVRLLLIFSLSAILLAAQGIYALISHLLTQHTREIGIRLALGAAPLQVARLVFRCAFALLIPGLVCGLAACAALSRVVSSLLFQVQPWDPFTMGAVAALLAITVLAASFPPARRSMRVDPATALRE